MLSRYLHNIFALPVLLVVCSGCGQGAALNRVLQSAGSNRVELVSVLDHTVQLTLTLTSCVRQSS